MNKTIKLDSKQGIFFTADNHFDHGNIIRYCDRPFDSLKEMNELMMEKWNNLVEPEDVVFILGDFCFGKVDTWVWRLSHLNGQKYLALGNHDKNVPAGPFQKIDNIFNLLIHDPEIKDGQRITLCHYPMLSWYQSHRGSWQLFGHVHGAMPNKPNMLTTFNQLDVGVDVHGFAPVSYQEVKEIITKQNM